MRTTNGFALPAALLIMLAVLTLGVSTLFITNTDLSTATNITTASVARHNADASMTIALHALEQHVTQHGALPDDLRFADNLTSINSWSADHHPQPQFTLDRVASTYDVDHLTGTATIRITGTGPNNSRYETQATVQLTTSNDGVPIIHPVVANGITAGGSAIIRGSGTLVDAGMHGNRGYSLNNDPRHTLYHCNHRRSDGTCQTRLIYPHNTQVPITAAADQHSYDHCSPSWFPGYCNGGTPLQLINDPFNDPSSKVHDIDPSYETARNNFLCSLSNNPSSCLTDYALNDIRCDVTLSNYPNANTLRNSITPGRTICINGGVGMPHNINLTGVNVIARDSISFNGSPEALSNTNLVSLNSSISFNGNADFKNTRMFANTTIQLNGSFTYENTVTLAAADTLQFNGTTRNPDGTARMALITDGNININGSGAVWAAFLAGGHINISGSAHIYGGLVSLGSTTINGTIFLDSGVPFENPDLPQVPGGSAIAMEVITRR